MLFNNNMSENRTSEGILTLVLSFTALMVSFFAGYNVARHHFADKHEIVTSDTIYVEHWDTIKIDQPKEVVRTIVRYDTLRQIEFVNVSDSDLLNKLDSLDLAIELPITQAIYRDSVENAKYEAYVSGYKAELDSINIHCRQTETIITKTERIPARRIGFGIQAGIGYAGKISPYIGVGIQYKLW